MRESARIAVAAHKRAMKFAEPGRKEYQVMAELLHEFRMNDADISYHPIVGGGANTCILHYHENSEELHDGDLLLIDAGCEYELYASDITRTFPVGGRFTPEQRPCMRSCWRPSTPRSRRPSRAIIGTSRTRRR